MKTVKRESTLFKVLHSCLLNAMICQVLLPATQANAAPLHTGTGFVVAQNAPAASLEPSAIPTAERIAKPVFPETPAVTTAVMVAGGPEQPESGRFSLNTTSSMVDPFTGDFSYSIPLMNVEGYPIVLNYNSNVGMTDEASWVGLGWNLNVGSVSREMRGLPDDFNGTDRVERTFSITENDVTAGYKVGGTAGILYKGMVLGNQSKFGLDATLLIGGYKNPYLGKGNTLNFNIGGQFSGDDGFDFGVKAGLGFSLDTKNGIGRSSSVGGTAGYESDNFAQFGYNWGSNYNSRSGVQQRNLGVTLSASGKVGTFGMAVQSGFGTTFTVGSITSVPRVELRATNQLTNVTAEFGVTQMPLEGGHWGHHLGLEVQGYNIEETFAYDDETAKTVKHPAYGYFHSQAASIADPNTIPLMDFNRERDGEFSEQMRNLAFSNPTYDIFYVNGLGIQATFRGHRREIGAYADGNITKESKGNIGTVAGTLIHDTDLKLGLGATYTDASGGTVSGKWEQASDPIGFRSDDEVFYKGIGEPTPTDETLLQLVGGEKPAALQLTKTESSGSVSVDRTSNLVYEGGSVALTSVNIANAAKKDIRANIYAPVMASELPASDASTQVYTVNQFTSPLSTIPLRRRCAERFANHISAMQVKTADGMNYTYGIPVYSFQQSEVSFSSCEANGTDGLATYTPGTSGDNTIHNSCGIANLFDKNRVPGYTSAFLLTSVTSSDYIDLTSDGFTSDDFGNYYKINNTRLYGDSSITAYKWRFPMCGGTTSDPEDPTAFFNEGLLSIDSDNTASYSYGEKEIWYTHSLESKNMIAEFVLEDRHDAFGVQGENGRLDETKPLQRLKRIELYNRNERINNVNAKPVQVVEFIYDYSLCQQNPSNNETYGGSAGESGKLTLKEIRFYSGAVSEEMALMPYVFTYSDVNPEFSYLSADRWGKYQPNDNPTTRPLGLFPYANQDETEANTNAQAWKLTTIKLPAGSEIGIEYESDSYRYVQNHRAMDLVSIAGYSWGQTVGEALNSGSWSTSSATDELYNASQGREVVIVQLTEPINAPNIADAANAFRQSYLRDPSRPPSSPYINRVYLRNFVQVKDGSGYELIPTFAPIADYGVYDNGSSDISFPATGVLPSSDDNYAYGYIVLKEAASSDEENHPLKMNPALKTALEFSRLHLSEIVYGTCPDCDPDLHIDRYTFWRGDVYKAMATSDYHYCNTVDLDRSEIRLFDHDSLRYGGNARVKQITMHDSWHAMSGENEEEGVYHWNYKYEDPRTAYGVAAYEPMSGNDENPFYDWSNYTNESVSFPNETRFNVEPVGEMLYPNPIVGYNRVEVRMSHDSGNNVDLGYAVNTYHTAYEHPVKVSRNLLFKVKADWTDYVSTETDLFGFTQGYSVVTNDFHGRPKEAFVYSGSSAGNVTLISRSEYIYRNLGEAVPMLDEKGTLAHYKTGMEYDLHTDSRFVRTTSEIVGLGLIVKFKVPSFVPTGFSPVIYSSKTESGFYTTTFNKHIHYSAVVDAIKTETTGSVNTAQNLVYDKYSGNVIVSSLRDEFRDTLYSISYPAHWLYTLLRNPLNQPTAAVSGTFAGGLFSVPTGQTIQDKFTVGDLVEATIGATTTELYVLSIDPNTEKLRLIDAMTAAAFTSGSGTLQLKKSGQKNILGPSMQQVVTKRNPLGSGSSFTFPTADVIDISALTLKPRTHVQCAEDENPGIHEDDVINPFDYGLLNNLMPEFRYTLQVERSSAQTQGIRYDGTLTDFVPFYGLNATNHLWYKISQSGHPDYSTASGDVFQNWRKNGEVITVNERGQALTATDAIKVPSAVIYGYNRLVPVAQAVNAEQHQIGFDSFEDYDYLTTESMPLDIGHFDFRKALQGSVSVVSTQKHSGLKSLKIIPGKSASVEYPVSQETCASTGKFGKDEKDFTVEECRCVKPFAPTPGDYIIGLWVKGNAVDDTTKNYSDVAIGISFTGSSTTFVFKPTGQKLDGWQRIEGKITIPSAATRIEVTLINISGGDASYAYFDDIRIHPFLAGMTTIVYDPATLLPLATHDGYNFTTFYNYDENLNQVRMRVETIDGIRTVTESEAGSVKDDKTN